MDTEWLAGLGLVKLFEGKEDIVGAEIGVSWGRTTEYLLAHLKFKRYYAIDPWLPYEGDNKGSVFNNKAEADSHYREAMKRILPHWDKVKVLEMTSKEAAEQVEDNELDFVFIDGDHSLNAVTEDLNLWWPKVKTGGIFSGHDWSYFEVAPAVRRFLKGSEKNPAIGPNDMWHVVK